MSLSSYRSCGLCCGLTICSCCLTLLLSLGCKPQKKPQVCSACNIWFLLMRSFKMVRNCRWKSPSSTVFLTPRRMCCLISVLRWCMVKTSSLEPRYSLYISSLKSLYVFVALAMVSLDCQVLSRATVARYLSMPCFFLISLLTACQLYNASSSEKYQPSSSVLPSKLGTDLSPLPGKSANGILGGCIGCTGFAGGMGATGAGFSGFRGITGGRIGADGLTGGRTGRLTGGTICVGGTVRFLGGADVVCCDTGGALGC
jgi:hypothetical protein